MTALPEKQHESKPERNPSGWKPWVTERPLASGGAAWVVNWHELQPGGGRKLKRKQFADLAELHAWRKTEKTRRNRHAELAHRSEQRGDAVAWWVRILPGERAAIMKAVEAMRDAGGRLDGMPEAVRLYCMAHLTGAKKTVKEIVDEHLERLEKTKRPATVADRRWRLSTLAEKHGKTLAATLTPAELEDWVLSIDKQPSQAARRRAVNALFAFAVRRGYLSTNPVARVERFAARSPDEVAVFAPGEAEAVLRAAQIVEPSMVPFFAIGIFAGLRPQNELRRLDWGNVNLDPGGKIKVVRSTAKTDRTRYVPIADNLRAWLRAVPMAEREGAIPYSRRSFRRVLDAARVDGKGRPVGFTVEAGKIVYKKASKPRAVTWSADIMRHTFCTYRQALIQNINQLCEEAGNTPSVARAHYLEPQESAEEVKEFWSIGPKAKKESKA